VLFLHLALQLRTLQGVGALLGGQPFLLCSAPTFLGGPLRLLGSFGRRVSFRKLIAQALQGCALGLHGGGSLGHGRTVVFLLLPSRLIRMRSASSGCQISSLLACPYIPARCGAPRPLCVCDEVMLLRGPAERCAFIPTWGSRGRPPAIALR
jgi:hypothetical protein